MACKPSQFGEIRHLKRELGQLVACQREADQGVAEIADFGRDGEQLIVGETELGELLELRDFWRESEQLVVVEPELG